MGKRMKYYLYYYQTVSEKELTPEEADRQCRELLVQIGFFQHERLIHLIVTVTFAILAVLILLAGLFFLQPLFLVLELLFLVLLIPYIKHYYLLENGTQLLYDYYDAIREKSTKRESFEYRSHICNIIAMIHSSEMDL